MRAGIRLYRLDQLDQLVRRGPDAVESARPEQQTGVVRGNARSSLRAPELMVPDLGKEGLRARVPTDHNLRTPGFVVQHAAAHGSFLWAVCAPYGGKGTSYGTPQLRSGDSQKRIRRRLSASPRRSRPGVKRRATA